MTPIDFAASGPHTLAHLVPVYDALPAEMRGCFYLTRGWGWTDEERERAASALFGDRPAMLVDFTDPHKTGAPLIGAAWGDVSNVRKTRPIALMEHGVGQTYRRANPAFAGGGRGREDVDLFLCPNEHTAALNREAFPDTPSVVVGIPWLDAWAPGRRLRPVDGHTRTVAFSWHWDMQTMGDAGRSAFQHHAPGLAQAIDVLRADGWDVIGTGHPKAWLRAPHLARWYDAHGVEPVRDLADVLDRADVMCCDVSSAAWLSASVGIAQVVLDAPYYRAGYDQQLWPRFALPLGYHAADPRVIPEQVELAHRCWADRAEFARSVREVVPLRDGRCAQRAADAIMEVFG